MILHIALSGLHLHKPAWRQIRQVAETAAVVASTAGWGLAAVTVVGLGYGLDLAVAVVLAAVGYGGYLVGAHRANTFWSARHRRVLEAFQRAQTAERQEAARRFAELSGYAAADREPYTSRKDRHLNSTRRPSAIPSNERSGR